MDFARFQGAAPRAHTPVRLDQPQRVTLRYGINALRLQGQRLGVGRYIESLLRHWDDYREPGESFVIYVREPWSRESLGLSQAFEVRHLASRLGGVWWEALVLARQWREVDVLFNPAYTIPLGYRGRSVVATHSVNEAHPGTHSLTYHLTYRPRNMICARLAEATIVPSAETRDQVARLYGVPRDRLFVVPQGAPPSFAPVRDPAALRSCRLRYLGEDVPYILFVGKLSERRNIPALIEAFGLLRKRHQIPHKLLLFGPNVSGHDLSHLAAAHGVSDRVVQTDGRIQRHEDILPVYSGATVYVHPTGIEGFSLTTVEALSCGLPVVTVGRGAMLEIVDDAALTVEQPQPEALAGAMARLLTDPDLRRDVSDRALERSRLFRTDRMAESTLAVMRSVALQDGSAPQSNPNE